MFRIDEFKEHADSPTLIPIPGQRIKESINSEYAIKKDNDAWHHEINQLSANNRRYEESKGNFKENMNERISSSIYIDQQPTIEENYLLENFQSRHDDENASSSSSHPSKTSQSKATGEDINKASFFEIAEDPFIHTKMTFCHKCNLRRPFRTHHCSRCDSCVLRMDHHCNWIANCVGIYNHKYYLLFLVYISLLGLCMSIFDLLKCYQVFTKDFTFSSFLVYKLAS